MKARPILFSDPMARALIDGRKTQTRRLIKPQPYKVDAGFAFSDPILDETGCTYTPIACPYGRIGDLLWVREAWIPPHPIHFPDEMTKFCYKATNPNPEAFKWKHARYMPRLVNRLTLELNNVRVERLQDISRTDAAAEGVCLDLEKPLPDWCKRDRWPEQNYAALWDTINGPGAWSTNPWVWVLSFRVHQKNVDAFLKERGAA